MRQAVANRSLACASRSRAPARAPGGAVPDLRGDEDELVQLPGPAGRILAGPTPRRGCMRRLLLLHHVTLLAGRTLWLGGWRVRGGGDDAARRHEDATHAG